MKPVYLHVAWSVKFRAVGITFGNYADKRIIALPKEFQLTQGMFHTPYTYDDHGIHISVSLSDTNQ